MGRQRYELTRIGQLWSPDTATRDEEVIHSNGSVYFVRNVTTLYHCCCII